MRYLTVMLLCLAMTSTFGADTLTDSDSADVTLTIEQYCFIHFDVEWRVFRGTQTLPCKAAEARRPRRYEFSIGTGAVRDVSGDGDVA